MIRLLTLLLSLFFFCHATCQEQLVPRKVLALYDSNFEKTPDDTLVHRICEMPLNYLGLDVIYHDLQEPLPDLSNTSAIRGILTCFPHGMHMKDPIAFLQWAEKAIDLGKKYVIVLDPGFKLNSEKVFTPDYLINSFYKKLGIYDRNDWTQYTFHYQILNKDRAVVEFEHPYPSPLPPFSSVTVVDPQMVSYLTVGIANESGAQADLVIAGPHGGYVSQYYGTTYTKAEQAPEARYWYINPFRFFQIAFGLDNLPVPDTTTLAGRRIFYSQINGDAWNALTEIEKYKKKRTLCSEVLFEEVLTHYRALPFSIGVIAADIDTNWVGNEKAQEVARKILALENVEVASHTYSHPFDWKFFEAPDQTEKEIDYLYLYPYGTWQNTYLGWLRAAYYLQRGKIALNEQNLGIGFVTPRAYANHPFDLTNEIQGSSTFIAQFAPEGKRVELFQWSGDCQPWAEAIQLTREMHLCNLNGGSTRKDAEKPSYCNVGPIGKREKDQIQIYASANDENDYTYDWTGRFYGFKYLVETFENTESPRRIKPLNLYFHVYSAEKLASLNALLHNLKYIDQQEVVYIWPSQYAAVADGFYSTEIQELASNKWRILNRGSLQTLRVDKPDLSVDYTQSEGVIGHRMFQNSLYVYLDAAHSSPTLTLQADGEGKNAYLNDSRWEVWDLKRSEKEVTFKTKGWKILQMRWKLPLDGFYLLQATDSSGNVYEAKSMKKEGLHTFELAAPFNTILSVKITHGGA